MNFCSKILLIISCWLFTFNYAHAQNLVPNPSFETYTTCPTGGSQVYDAVPWIGPTCNSTDYFNACSSTNGFPFNGMYPRTGNAMVGIYGYNGIGINYREYIQVKLDSILKVGGCYYVEFYIVLYRDLKYAINNMGAYFSNQAFTTSLPGSSAVALNYTPNILKFDNPIVYDTISWTKVVGIYTANGTENYITIGNFKDDINTDTLMMYPNRPSAAYYFIDDVSVIPTDSISLPPYAGNDTTIAFGDSVFIGQQLYGLHCNWYSNSVLLDTNISGIWVKPNITTTYVVQQTLCGNIGYDTVVVTVSPLGIKEFKNGGLKIYPNPTKEILNIEYENAEIKITDVVGNLIKQQKIATYKTTINVCDLKDGVYFILLSNKNTTLTKKLIIQH